MVALSTAHCFFLCLRPLNHTRGLLFALFFVGDAHNCNLKAAVWTMPQLLGIGLLSSRVPDKFFVDLT